jgi:hypothetical protein
LVAIFKYRTGYFNVIAKDATCIVGSDETARWYESWIDDSAKLFLDDTLSRIRCKDPGAGLAPPPFFHPEDMARFEGEITLEVMRIVRHYKTEVASIVLRIKRAPSPAGMEKSNSPEEAARKRGRHRGFAADVKRHNSIADIVVRHHPTWEKGSADWKKDSTLKGICTDLDAADIDIPDNWRTGTTPSLNEVKLKSWSDALDLGYKKLVIDQIRYSLDVVLKGRSSASPET